MMEELIYVDRNSNCNKWMVRRQCLARKDTLCMDFKIPQCVQKALHDYVDFNSWLLSDSRWIL